MIHTPYRVGGRAGVLTERRGRAQRWGVLSPKRLHSSFAICARPDCLADSKLQYMSHVSARGSTYLCVFFASGIINTMNKFLNLFIYVHLL